MKKEEAVLLLIYFSENQDAAVVIRGANKKQKIRITKIEFEILNFCENNFLTLFELIIIIGSNMINNKETILSITDKLS